eukprot:360288-Chlamydomonas_euryale.AAC.6
MTERLWASTTVCTMTTARGFYLTAPSPLATLFDAAAAARRHTQALGHSFRLLSPLPPPPTAMLVASRASRSNAAATRENLSDGAMIAERRLSSSPVSCGIRETSRPPYKFGFEFVRRQVGRACVSGMAEIKDARRCETAAVLSHVHPHQEGGKRRARVTLG